MAEPKRPAVEALLVYFAIFLVLALIQFVLGRSLGKPAVAGALMPALLLWGPLILLYFNRRSFRDYGIHVRGWPREIGKGLMVSGILLPLFVAGYLLFWNNTGVWHLTENLNSRLFRQITIQLLAVAIPEEVFFRGYLQTLLAKAWRGKPWPLVGEMGPAIVITAVLFALMHVAGHPAVQRLGVFFPGLLFGVLRVQSGSLVAPITVHLLANLTVYMLEGHV